MPHEPKFNNQSDAVVATITCSRCKYTWTPNASRWRNINGILKNSKKILFCPYCMKRLTLDEYTTEALVMISIGKPIPNKLEYFRKMVNDVGRKQERHLRDC